MVTKRRPLTVPPKPAVAQMQEGDGRIEGRIARVLPEKGFGFIYAGDEREYFFHRSELDPMPTYMDKSWEGRVVNFIPQATPKGPRAADVRFSDPHDPE